MQERSKFKKIVWEDPRSNSEFPTPYAFLLYTISADLAELSRSAVQQATCRSMPARVKGPGQVAQAIAQNWSFCVWSIADSQCQVAPEFRSEIIRDYLAFILELGWQPSEIYFGSTGNVEGLDAWRDLFLVELQKRFTHGGPATMAALKEAAESLDKGKGYYNGYAWLEKQIFGSH